MSVKAALNYSVGEVHSLEHFAALLKTKLNISEMPGSQVFKCRFRFSLQNAIYRFYKQNMFKHSSFRITILFLNLS